MRKSLRRITAVFALAAALVVSLPRPAAAAGYCVIVTNDEPWVEVVVCEPWV